MDNILSVLLMIFASLVAFLLIDKVTNNHSSWVVRLVKLSSPLGRLSPTVLFFGFLIYLAGMLWVLVNLFQYNPEIIKWVYIFSITNVSFTTLSLWLDKYWPNTIVFVLLKIIASAILGFSWVYYPEWFVYNTVGVLGIVAIVTIFPKLDFWRMYAIGIAIVVYDVFGVYLTGWIVDLVRGFSFVPPAVLMIPTSLSQSTHSVIIGLGDIIIGALFLKMAKGYGLESPAVLSYIFAVIFAFTLAISTNLPVPATIYICPLMLLAVWFSSVKKPALNPIT